VTARLPSTSPFALPIRAVRDAATGAAVAVTSAAASIHHVADELATSEALAQLSSLETALEGVGWWLVVAAAAAAAITRRMARPIERSLPASARYAAPALAMLAIAAALVGAAAVLATIAHR
jgi:hypothetical protein